MARETKTAKIELSEDEIFWLEAAVENLRAPERTPAVIDGAWRVASKLADIASRAHKSLKPAS